MKTIMLAPVRESSKYYDIIEKHISEVFKREIYWPLIEALGEPKSAIMNSLEDLTMAIDSGRIYFVRGEFKGRYSAKVSKELRRLGARWDRKHGCWKIPLSQLPDEIRAAIDRSERKHQISIQKIDRQLAKLLPEKIAEKVQLEKLFDSALWETEKSLHETMKSLVVPPELTPERRRKISEEYEQNMRLYIKDWTEKEIVRLRKEVQESAFAGNRYETMLKTIQKSYGVSHAKAKFLARQETSLLVTKFKETRYLEAGVKEYRWTCVNGSPNHPVRPMHKALDGKVFSWDNPPIVNEKGERKNPGQDYNCRCFARPIVRF